MYYYLIALVMSCFLGTKLFALDTPVAQITIYRLLALGLPVMIAYQLANRNAQLKIAPKQTASSLVIGYLHWWGYALISVMWVWNVKAWFQAVFLMSIGIFAIVGLFLYTQSLKEWLVMIKGLLVMIIFQVSWGYVEIITGRYLFADLAKLDKYNTFNSAPMTRIPITYFANQNDYATFLLAVILFVMIVYHIARTKITKFSILALVIGMAYLIYRSGSRMALLVLVMIGILTAVFSIHWRVHRQYYIRALIALSASIVAILLVKPSLLMKVYHLIFSISQQRISGDQARIHLWKNGFIFLAETFGFGVGAGNVETWMGEVPYFSTNSLVNMHNWWLEILVGYGVFSFVIYVAIYWLMIRKLWIIFKSTQDVTHQIAKYLLIFLITFIFSSITSANNMLIEWHWVIFGLIISFIKVVEKQG